MASSELLVSPTPIGSEKLPPLDAYVAEAADRGFLGMTNANRLLASEGADLSDDTLQLLWDVSEGTHSDYPQFCDFIAPLLRSLDCFDLEDLCRYNQEGFPNTWDQNIVWTKDNDTGESTTRGIVVFREEQTQFELPVEWPALVPINIHDTLVTRELETDTFASCVKNVGRVFFELSYFDPQAAEQSFVNSIEEALDFYRLR
ncbi:MAG TPA: hypothetical protein VLE69_02315 [Candidatus Saccharimonadales bacterium]|nr:hypothetical protein [Candidatus Saccharimonadales bacterium]